MVVLCLSGYVLVSIDEVTIRRARLILGWVNHLQRGTGLDLCIKGRFNHRDIIGQAWENYDSLA